MVEVTIHEDDDVAQARERVREFVDVGDEVEVYRAVMTEETNNRIEGTVAALEEEVFGIETSPGDVESVAYTDVDRLSLVTDR